MTASPRPTSVRYLIVGVTALAAVLLYLDRVCISFTAVYVQQDLGLTREEMSYALGAFFFAYALAQVPGGWLGDRFGARLTFALCVLLWSAFTAGTALATGLLTLLLARLAFGLAQAGAYPTAAGLVRSWAPPDARGTASGLVSLGGRLGGASASLLTALLLVAFVPPSSPSALRDDDLRDADLLRQQLANPKDDTQAELARRLRPHLPGSSENSALRSGLNEALDQPDLTARLDFADWPLPREARSLLARAPEQRSAAETQRLNRLVLETAHPGALRQLHGDGWRPVLLTYGAVGLLVAALYWFVVRDAPRRHPWCNAAEVALIEAGERPAVSDPAERGIPWRLLLTNRNLWLTSLGQFCTNIGWAFLVTLFPGYLADAFAVPIEQRGVMVTTALLVGCLGMFAGGWLTDALVRRIGRRRGRSLPIGLTQFVCALACLSCPWLPSAWAVVAALAVMAFAVDLGVPSIWAFLQDVSGRHTGSALGFGNTWGNFGAALSPVLLAFIQRQWGWGAAFVTCAVTFTLAGLAGLRLDATRPMEAAEGAGEGR